MKRRDTEYFRQRYIIVIFNHWALKIHTDRRSWILVQWILRSPLIPSLSQPTENDKMIIIRQNEFICVNDKWIQNEDYVVKLQIPELLYH